MTKRISYVAAGCLVLILGLITLHTPVSMLVGMLVPSAAIIVKGWKEVVLIIAALCCVAAIVCDHAFLKKTMHDRLIWIAGAFVGLHLMLSAYHFHGWYTYFAGLANDLRYIVVLVVSLIIAQKVSWTRTRIVHVAAAGAILVGVFGLLQLTVLPHDILKYIGYDWQPGKVAPYLTVDSDTSFVRINSTLRGPNPLGFYAATILTVSSAWLIMRRKEGLDRKNIIVGILAGLMAACLWFSYSRGALIAAIVGVVIVIVAAAWSRHKKVILSILGLTALALVLLMTTLRHNEFVATVVFHDSPSHGAQATSNEGHISSLESGMASMLRQPLGAGIGSTGSASYYADNTSTLYIENQYLFIAHEAGWAGLILFLALFGVLTYRLWVLRKDYLALAMFASGLGLAITSLVLPVWSDDTIAYIWWGLAGVAVYPYMSVKRAKPGWLRGFMQWNRRISKRFDEYFIPSHWRVDGLRDYHEAVVPPLLKHARIVHDVGGGKLPYLGSVVPKMKDQTLIGFDIDEQELLRAPKGVYDSWVVGDIGSSALPKPRRKADLVICQVVLEHVQDNMASIKNIVENTRKGGTVTLFVPSRNAAFARLNALLPQRLKERILFGVFPEARHAQGFPAYYHLCTASQMSKILEDNGCEIVDQRDYYQGYYFSFFTPLHVIWRLCQAIAYLFTKNRSADFYCLVAVKR